MESKNIHRGMKWEYIKSQRCKEHTYGYPRERRGQVKVGGWN